MAFRLSSFVRCTNNVTQSLKQAHSSRAAQQISPASFFHTSQIRFNEHIINIQDEEDFKERVLQSKTPVIVDFHASWCGPCKILGPRLESLVGAEEGKVVLAKVDIDDMPDMAMEHGVQAVPTVFGMREGKVADKFVGLKDDDQLQSFIQKLAGK